MSAELDQQILSLYHLLNQGSGIQGLVNRLEEYLPYPISVLDASYNIIALSPRMQTMPFGILRSEEGMFLAEIEIESLRRLQIEKQIYRQNQAFFTKTADHPDSNWIFAPIRIQRIMAGYAAVCLGARDSATEDELTLVSEFAAVCAVEMQKQDFFLRRTGLPYESFLLEMIEGKYSDVDLIRKRFAVLNRSLGTCFCVAILEERLSGGNRLFLDYQMQLLRRSYPNSMSAFHQGRIVILISQDTPILLTSAFTEPLERFCRQHNMLGSLSQPFQDIRLMNRYYIQAVNTLGLLDHSDPEKYLYYGTDAVLPYLFSNCDYVGLQIGVHYHIYRLQEHDAEFHTDFLKTLREFFNCGRNATQAAEALHIHRSTFFYRIKKMEELLDISFLDSHLLFLYELSLKILDYIAGGGMLPKNLL